MQRCTIIVGEIELGTSILCSKTTVCGFGYCNEHAWKCREKETTEKVCKSHTLRPDSTSGGCDDCIQSVCIV